MVGTARKNCISLWLSRKSVAEPEEPVVMTTTPREDPPSPPRVSISVRNPRTHGEGSDAYTSYLIYFDSNDQAFSNVHSEARRRYSDFVWLRKHLADRFHKKTPPKLPPKTFFQSKLDPLVVENRKMGLEKFLCDVLKDREYLPDIRLHLFLQTDMPVDNIESSVSGISTHAPFTMTVVTERAVSEELEYSAMKVFIRLLICLGTLPMEALVNGPLVP